MLKSPRIMNPKISLQILAVRALSDNQCACGGDESRSGAVVLAGGPAGRHLPARMPPKLRFRWRQIRDSTLRGWQSWYFGQSVPCEAESATGEGKIKWEPGRTTVKTYVKNVLVKKSRPQQHEFLQISEEILRVSLDRHRASIPATSLRSKKSCGPRPSIFRIS